MVCDLRPFSAIANQESLSGLEVEMRKLEGVVKEIVDEMGYLEEREQRFSNTNSASYLIHDSSNYSKTYWYCSFDKPTCSKFRMVYYLCACGIRRVADFPP